ncbi:MAG: type II secretion system F family protein [Bdellovibrionales bacterium]|nr:type II secretion system F family protein [Bdellovibrionales bacterium]
MSSGLVIVIILIITLGVLLTLTLLGVPIPGFSQNAASAQVSKLVQSQRTKQGELKPQKGRAQANADEDDEPVKVQTSKITLDKELRYAQWKIPPLLYYVAQVLISLVVCYLMSLAFNKLLTLVSLVTGPMTMRFLLNFLVNRRFNAFDKDYASFLASLVSLLRTGMETLTALEAAAQGLEDGSLVQEEVLLMLDRLRFGVTEEKSIGAFGEDVYHPEIELFVQALLLSRSVGGNLSETLDRLAKQVRKRQRFRADAEGAVGLQKGSILFILAIMVGIEFYIYFMFPAAVVDAINDPTGWEVWQAGIMMILMGLVWIKQVTKMRI